MEDGIVTGVTDRTITIWVVRLSRIIAKSIPHSADRLKVGTYVKVTVDDVRKEIKHYHVMAPMGEVTASFGKLQVRVDVIFPPKEILKKTGNVLFSPAIGIIPIPPGWESLFINGWSTQSVFKATVTWNHANGRFDLDPRQNIVQMNPTTHIPKFNQMLRLSPWNSITDQPTNTSSNQSMSRVSPRLLTSPVPSEDNNDEDDDSSDEGPETFTRTGIIMSRSEINTEWRVFVLDQNSMNQWKNISERILSTMSPKPAVGSTVQLNLSQYHHMFEWTVVEHEQSCKPINHGSDAWLDIQVRVDRVVKLDNRQVIRLYNKRVGEVYDYNHVLGNLKKGEQVRVLARFCVIKQSGVNRSLWMVQGYGKEPLIRIDRRKETKKENSLKEHDRDLKTQTTLEDERWMEKGKDDLLLTNDKCVDVSLSSEATMASTSSSMRFRPTDVSLIALTVRMRDLLKNNRVARVAVEDQDESWLRDAERVLDDIRDSRINQ